LVIGDQEDLRAGIADIGEAVLRLRLHQPGHLRPGAAFDRPDTPAAPASHDVQVGDQDVLLILHHRRPGHELSLPGAPVNKRVLAEGRSHDVQVDPRLLVGTPPHHRRQVDPGIEEAALVRQPVGDERVRSRDEICKLFAGLGVVEADLRGVGTVPVELIADVAALVARIEGRPGGDLVARIALVEIEDLFRLAVPLADVEDVV
jgi:hypothetical protein